ncbi:MAG: hypothetical protein WKF84_06520 [Pyrinomonadaceae bacterium]
MSSERAKQSLTFSPTTVPLSASNLPTPAAPQLQVKTPPQAYHSQISDLQPLVAPRTALDTTLASLDFDAKSPLLGTGPLNFDLADLHLCLLDEQELKQADWQRCLCAWGAADGADPVENAEVTIKILGTTFHPVIINLKTNQLGMAVSHTTLPKFNAGRAAIWWCVPEYEGREVMLRRVVQRA